MDKRLIIFLILAGILGGSIADLCAMMTSIIRFPIAQIYNQFLADILYCQLIGPIIEEVYKISFTFLILHYILSKTQINTSRYSETIILLYSLIVAGVSFALLENYHYFLRGDVCHINPLSSYTVRLVSHPTIAVLFCIFKIRFWFDIQRYPKLISKGMSISPCICLHIVNNQFYNMDKILKWNCFYGNLTQIFMYICIICFVVLYIFARNIKLKLEEIYSSNRL